MEVESLDEVRTNIDRIDKEIIALMAERGDFVRHAAKFKKSSTEVAAPTRVEQVISKVRTFAIDAGLEPQVAEAAYRSMIDAFIALEQTEFQKQSTR